MSKRERNKRIHKTNFRFHPDILRRLGEELNLSPGDGIIELVKNSYDADALKCTVSLINTNEPGGTIIIEDNGDGMTTRDIEDLWLVLGLSRKSQNKKTKLGRIQAGNKGLGRLAALRLGEKVKLTTVYFKQPFKENYIEINWDKYDEINVVEEEKLYLYTTSRENEQKQGTRISIENLHSGLKRTEVKRLARAMILFADPFNDVKKGFKPVLKAPEYQDLEKLVKNSYFKDAEYHLVAILNNNGLAKAEVLDWQGNLLYQATHKDIRPKHKEMPYGCPSCSFNFWAFVLNQSTFSTHSTTLGEVKDWLAEFGGIHIYYNGLRVKPYGDKGDDWLGINQLRVRNPEERPATYSSIGKIDIIDNNNIFKQKTDRSGFIINNSFLELKQFAEEVLEWMARRRLADAEKRRAKTRQELETKSSKKRTAVTKGIEKLPDEYRKEIESKFSAYEKERDKQVKHLQREVQLYRTLATVGITSAVFAHESANNPLKIISQSIKTLRYRTEKFIKELYTSKFKKPIERIMRGVESLSVLTNVTLSLVDHEKRRASRIDIHQVISDVIELYQPFINERDVKVTIEFDHGNPYLRGSVAALESIISNLLNNSLAIFEKRGERNVFIKTNINSEFIIIRVFDNGPGIVGINLKDIWLPGQTTKKNGTGLGLTIVRDAVIDLGGNVNAIEKGKMGGAEFIIELPIIGV